MTAAKPIELTPAKLLLALSIHSLKGTASTRRVIFPGIGSAGVLTFDPERWNFYPWEYGRESLKIRASLRRFLTFSFRLKPELDGGNAFLFQLHGSAMDRQLWIEGEDRGNCVHHWFNCPECGRDSSERPDRLFIQPQESWIGCARCLETRTGERRLIQLYDFYLHAGPRTQKVRT